MRETLRVQNARTAVEKFAELVIARQLQSRRADNRKRIVDKRARAAELFDSRAGSVRRRGRNRAVVRRQTAQR